MSDPQGKKVDEDWKRRAQEEKERLNRQRPGGEAPVLETPPGVVRERPQESRRRTEGEPRTDSGDEGTAHPGYPEVSFETFTAGLAAQALIALGQMEHPESRRRELDLDAARYTIDTLAMLRRKTKGNLTPEEENRLEAILAELQMIFVQISNRAGQKR